MDIVQDLKPQDLKQLHRIPPMFREVVYHIHIDNRKRKA